MATGHNDVQFPVIEQQVIERPKGRRQKFPSSLRERTFGHRPDQMRLIGEATEEVVKFTLQASRHAANQIGNEIGERECAAAREIRRADPIGRDEFLSVERGLDSGHQRGIGIAEFVYPIGN